MSEEMRMQVCPDCGDKRCPRATDRSNECDQHWLAINTEDYRVAPSSEGPQAGKWRDKPHRLVYDLCSAVEALRRQAEQMVCRLCGAKAIVRPDDGEVIQADWIIDLLGSPGRSFNNEPFWHTSHDHVVLVATVHGLQARTLRDDNLLCELATRGELRTLCHALGITLNEPGART